MDMKISSLQIKCKTNNVFIQFSKNISLIYGNSGVGKTTLLNLVSYGLGNDLVKTQIVEQEVQGVCLNVWLNGELISFDRKINSNLIMMMKNGETICLTAKGGTLSGYTALSDFLYNYEGLQAISMVNRKSAKEVKVSFANYMWFSYLRQEELDNTLFYLDERGGNHKDLASKYVMKILLDAKDVSEKELVKEINVLKENKERLAQKEEAARDMLAASSLFGININQEIVRKQKEIARLRDEVSEFTAWETTDSTKEKFAEVLEKQRNVGRYEAEVRYLKEFGKVYGVANRYHYEAISCNKRIRELELNRASADNTLFERNICRLEMIFLNCLLDVGFSQVEIQDYVKIDRRNFLPSLYSKYNEFKFDYANLSSGGKKTIFKICYALSIHIFVNESRKKSILPHFLIIDTPMKNISEREDRELYENLYGYFVKLFSDGGVLENYQLIIVDKEKASIFRNVENAMFRHMSNEEPLIEF